VVLTVSRVVIIENNGRSVCSESKVEQVTATFSHRMNCTRNSYVRIGLIESKEKQKHKVASQFYEAMTRIGEFKEFSVYLDIRE